MNWSVFKLTLRSAAQKKSLLVLISFLTFPLLLAWLVRGSFSGQEGVVFNNIFFFLMYPVFASGLLALLAGTGLIKGEQQSGTIVYLLTSPVTRRQLFLSKLLATIFVLFSLTTVSLLLCTLILGGVGENSSVFRLVLAILFATAGYNTLYFFLSTLVTKKTMTIVFVIGMAEFAVSLFPALVNRFTFSYYCRSVVLSPYSDSIESPLLQRALGDEPMLVSMICVTALCACLFFLATWIIDKKEFLPSAES